MIKLLKIAIYLYLGITIASLAAMVAAVLLVEV